jgi:hypothetical protein
MLPFANQGYGKHMRLHVYDVMSPEYVPPTVRNDFKPVTLADVSGEEDKFFLKVVN